MDRGAWRTIVCGMAESQTQLSAHTQLKHSYCRYKGALGKMGIYEALVKLGKMSHLCWWLEHQMTLDVRRHTF